MLSHDGGEGQCCHMREGSGSADTYRLGDNAEWLVQEHTQHY